MDMLIVLLLVFVPGGVLTFVGYNVFQSSAKHPQNEAFRAVDGDMTSCARTRESEAEYWGIQFNQSLTVAGVSFQLSGGNYTIQVENRSSEYSQDVCSNVKFPFPFSQYDRVVTCTRPLHGDVIIIKRTRFGFLKLCYFKLKVCEENSLGIPCTKCTPESTCRSCDGSHHGVWCEHRCSPGCVPGLCDELNGRCACQDGFRGKQCQFTEDCSSVSSSCSECDVLNQNCTVCRESRFGEMCQLDCPQHCEKCDINNGTCLQCETGHTGVNCTELE